MGGPTATATPAGRPHAPHQPRVAGWRGARRLHPGRALLAALLRELRAIDFVKDLIAAERMPAGAMMDVLVHKISDDAQMTGQSLATKTVPSPVIFDRLHAAGRAAADRFLDAHLDDLNRRSTVDLTAVFG